MRVKQQTAPIWDFLNISFDTIEKLEEGVVDPADCGPYIVEVEANDDGDRCFILDWNETDHVYCEGVDELTLALQHGIHFAHTSDRFRRNISGSFYNRVAEELDGALRCGDTVAHSILVSFEAAKEAAEQFNQTNLYARNLEEMEKTPLRLATLAKMVRRCDRLIKAANDAYNVVCFTHGAYWEYGVSELIERDEPYPPIVITAEYTPGQPDTLKGFVAHIHEEEHHFPTIEDAEAFAFKHSDTVYRSSTVDDFFSEAA